MRGGHYSTAGHFDRLSDRTRPVHFDRLSDRKEARHFDWLVVCRTTVGETAEALLESLSKHSVWSQIAKPTGRILGHRKGTKKAFRGKIRKANSLILNLCFNGKWSIGESNSWPFECHSNALPTELIPHWDYKDRDFFSSRKFFFEFGAIFSWSKCNTCS